jgi:hypothetical protein
MRPGLAAAILVVAATPAGAHRLDEYLQSTIISLEKNRVEAQMTLTPGVAVFQSVISHIDTDANGVISQAEQHAYAVSVLRDLALSIDGHRLTPRLLSARFPAVEEMREGRGVIELDFDADLPSGGSERRLTLENHHQSAMSAYQVNCLVPRDPDIRIRAQNRNYSQSFYELDFLQAGARSSLLSLPWLPGAREWLVAVALLLVPWLALLWRRHLSQDRHLGPRRRYGAREGT